MVIQPPAHVLGVGLAAVAPPGVGLISGGGVELAVHIHQAGLAQQAGHPGALFGQKAGVFAVAFPVLQVDFLVGNVHVTHQNKVALGLEPEQVRVELIQKAELGLLALFARRATGEIGADDAVFGVRRIKAQFHVAAFGVKLARAVAGAHVTGFQSGVQAHARVAFFLGKMKVAL